MDRAQVEFLGLVAYASLAAFEQTASASAAAPRLGDKLVLARIAAQRFSHVQQLAEQLAERGSRLDAAMQPFVAPVDGFNQHTAPQLWGEQLVKLCVTGGLVRDFAEQATAQLGDELAAILAGTIDDGDLTGEPARMLATVLDEDPELIGRLQLFARRLLGELLSQAQRVAAMHPGLTGLVTGEQDGGDDLAAVSDLMGRLAGAHARRLEQLGL